MCAASGECEDPIYESLLYLLLSIVIAEVAMVPNLGTVWQVASSKCCRFNTQGNAPCLSRV